MSLPSGTASSAAVEPASKPDMASQARYSAPFDALARNFNVEPSADNKEVRCTPATLGPPGNLHVRAR